jgi:hypothetical protein
LIADTKLCPHDHEFLLSKQLKYDRDQYFGRNRNIKNMTKLARRAKDIGQSSRSKE